MGSLKDYVAIVTGAAGGIGQGIVRRYVQEGARVIAADLNVQPLQTLESLHPESIVAIRADVGQPADNRLLVAAALERFGKLDVFCANAGIYDQNVALCELTDSQIDTGFDEIFAINVKSILYAAAASFEALLETRGCLIATASFASTSPAGGGVLYTASKHAVVGVVKQLAYEFAPDIRVNAIAPGIAPTTLRGVAALGQQPKDSVLDGTERAIPLQKIPDSDAYGGLYALLASREDAGHITGAVYTADSGLAVRGMARPGGRVR